MMEEMRWAMGRGGRNGSGERRWGWSREGSRRGEQKKPSGPENSKKPLRFSPLEDPRAPQHKETTGQVTPIHTLEPLESALVLVLRVPCFHPLVSKGSSKRIRPWKI